MPPPAVAGPLIIATLGILSTFGPLSMDMYLPSLPGLADYFGTTVSNAQLTLSAFTIGFAVGQLFYGPLSDRLGRKRVLLGGIMLYTAAGLLCALSPDIESLIFFRFLQALGGGAGVALTRAIIRDLLSGDAGARALSLMLLVPSLAALVGPFIGGQILLWTQWRVIFWLLAGFGVIALILAILRLPETLPPEKRRTVSPAHILRDYGTVLCDRRALGFMLCGAFSFSGLLAQLSGTPFVYIQLFGVAPENFGYLFALNVIGIMIGSYANSRLVTRFGIRRMLVVSTSIALAGGLLLAWFGLTGMGGLAGIVISLMIFMVPHNMTNANATAGALENFSHIAGTASALIGAIRFGTGSLMGAAVGLLHDGTAVPMTMVIAGCAVGSAAAFWWLTPDRRTAA